MFFNSFKEINRLRKYINRLLSQRTQNIYLKVTIEENWRSQNFHFLSLKNLSTVPFNFKTSCYTLKIRGLGAKLVWLFYYFNFAKNYNVLMAKSPCILLNKNKNFNKNEMKSKMENPTPSFRENSKGVRSLCFSYYKNRKLKVKLWWFGTHERKKRAFFVPFILSEGNFFNIYVSSQCIVYWIYL